MTLEARSWSSSHGHTNTLTLGIELQELVRDGRRRQDAEVGEQKTDVLRGSEIIEGVQVPFEFGRLSGDVDFGDAGGRSARATINPVQLKAQQQQRPRQTHR